MLRSVKKTSPLSPLASSRPSTKKRKRTRQPTRSSGARFSRRKRTRKKTKKPRRKTALRNAKRFAPAKRQLSPRMCARDDRRERFRAHIQRLSFLHAGANLLA